MAVRSTRAKLQALVSNNGPILKQNGFEATVADVQYVDGLKNPNEQVQERIYQILEEVGEFRVGQFIIKSSIFEFEQEVRAIIYSKGDPFKPLEDPYPAMSGYSMPLGFKSDKVDTSVSAFIDAIYVHPTLNDDSMMVQSVREINAHLGAADIPVVADRIEALGTNVMLRPASERG